MTTSATGPSLDWLVDCFLPVARCHHNCCISRRQLRRVGSPAKFQVVGSDSYRGHNYRRPLRDALHGFHRERIASSHSMAGFINSRGIRLIITAQDGYVLFPTGPFRFTRLLSDMQLCRYKSREDLTHGCGWHTCGPGSWRLSCYRVRRSRITMRVKPILSTAPYPLRAKRQTDQSELSAQREWRQAALVVACLADVRTECPWRLVLCAAEEDCNNAEEPSSVISTIDREQTM